MRATFAALATLVAVGFATSAVAANFEFHGDFNNRFMLYTNQARFFTADKADQVVLADEDTEESFASIKYRLWTKAATSDGNVKGVLAVELGAVRFGRQGSGKSQGGGFSGDGVNLEVRWAYTDFQLPKVESKARLLIGLQPYKVNSFVWAETAAGVQLLTDKFSLAWMRGKEAITGPGENLGDNDLDGLSARYDFKSERLKAGLFGLFQWQDTSDAAAFELASHNWEVKKFGDVKFDLFTFGSDGSFTNPTTFGNVFVNWDLMYQTGSMDNVVFTDFLSGIGRTGNFDLNAYLGHLDVGANVGRTRFTYSAWYASGDDNPTDNDFDAFLATDVDRFDSIILFEGGYTDDFMFTERPYLFDKGLIFNKLSVDHKASEKLKFGVAGLYLLTAEDLEYIDDFGVNQSQDKIGFEFDGYVSYMLYPQVEFAVNAGFLFAGDAMDIFDTQVDGDADNNIFSSTARIRYKF